MISEELIEARVEERAVQFELRNVLKRLDIATRRREELEFYARRARREAAARAAAEGTAASPDGVMKP